MLDLVALLGRVGEPSVLGVLLKHTHSMLPFYQAFAKGGKQLLNRLVSIWSRAEETPRILAFMCIVKLVRGRELLEPAVKAMYLAYVKQVLEKTVANAKFIETRRKNVSFGVGDKTAIQAWEAQVARDGTPLLAFYKSWKKVSDVQQAKKVSDQEKISDFSHIPALKKNHKKLRMKREQEEEVEGGFLSGSDDDFDEEENFKLKEERGKKRKNSGDDESESEEESPKKTKKSIQDEEEEEEDPDDDVGGDEDDKVEDLILEDLDSDLELEDDFGAASDADEDDSDQGEEEDSDDESD